MRLSVILPTIGRPGLEPALQSITSQWLPGDEVLVVGATPAIQAMAEKYQCRFVQCPPGKDWGHSERNMASPLAHGEYVAHLDDDDVWAPGARAAIEAGIMASPPGHPLMFKMEFANGGRLWDKPLLRYGNVGTPMIVLPNEPAKFGRWANRYGGDFVFMSTLGWTPDELIWREDVIALIRPAAVHV